MEEEEIVADPIEWDNQENEDALIGIGSSLQASGPFPSHGGEGTSGKPAEVGRTVGLPLESIEAGGSAVALDVPAEAGGPTVVPQEPRGAGRSTNVPQELPGASPSAQEQGAGSKRPRSDEAERGSGRSPPKRICCPTALR